MSPLSPLGQRAYQAARHGTYEDAKDVFHAYAHDRRWVSETQRARWDGAAALLEWWHALEPIARPPLDRFRMSDARAFVGYLEAKGLARSTVKSYRTSARAFIRAIAWALENLQRPTYVDPFQFATPTPKGRTVPAVDHEKLEAMMDVRAQAKLRVLLTLMELGVGLPEVCTLYWSDVDVQERCVRGYHKRVVMLHPEALGALEALWEVLPRGLRSRNRRVLCWAAGTARSWLKEIMET